MYILFRQTTDKCDEKYLLIGMCMQKNVQVEILIGLVGWCDGDV